MFYSIYGAQQRFNLPIDKSIKRAARKNIAESLRADAAFIKLMVCFGISSCRTQGLVRLRSLG